MRTEKREDFLDELGIRDVTMGQQVHGTRFAYVKESDKGKVLPGMDGLIATSGSIAVTFADCVPLLAVDPKAGIIGTAHAGWKGTLAGIATELIRQMKNAGADVGNIYISIGPHIGMCCYNVLEDRVLAFQKRFGRNGKIAARIQGEWHLDIGYANFQLLRAAGVPAFHIDAPPTCTSCQVAIFNSYRKDPKEKFGVQLGVIAL